MKTNYAVFFIEEGRPQFVETDKLAVALALCESFRKMAKEGMDIRHVTMSCENSDQVGQNGVDSIVDGKCPDGVPYTWVKRRAPDKPKQCAGCNGAGEQRLSYAPELTGYRECPYCKGAGTV